MSQSELVVITGITGYLGAATLLEFLQSAPPQFRIRGTVRDKTNEAKLKPVRDGVGEALFSKVELVDADLLDADSLDKALAGAAYVVHTASPFHFNGGCVDPAVKGTLAVMEACAKHKVKRVVMTSSVAAILSLAAADKEKRGHATPYDETCWSNPERPEGLGDYPTSKTLAEKAAWGFVRSQGPSFDLVVIHVHHGPIAMLRGRDLRGLLAQHPERQQGQGATRAGGLCGRARLRAGSLVWGNEAERGRPPIHFV